MSGTHAPWGIFFNEAPQKRPDMTSGSAHTRQSLDSSLTIEETKETKEQNRENDRKVFDVADLHCDEHRGRKHDCRDGKSVGVRELRSIVERGDKDDRCYHNWRPDLKSLLSSFRKKKTKAYGSN